VSEYAKLFNDGDLLTTEGSFTFPAGNYRVIGSKPKERILLHHKESGAQSAHYPFSIILHFGIPVIDETCGDILCPICWGKGATTVHVYYGSGKGGWKSAMCDVCSGKGHMPASYAIQWLREEIARRADKRKALEERRGKS
jgi:hypothetical protein